MDRPQKTLCFATSSSLPTSLRGSVGLTQGPLWVAGLIPQATFSESYCRSSESMEPLTIQKSLSATLLGVGLLATSSPAVAAPPSLTGFSYREAGFGGCQGSAVLKGQDPVRGVQLAAWEYGGKGPGVVNFVVALDGVMQNLAARNSQFEDGDGKMRSTYETEFGVYKISVVFVLAGLKGSEVLAGDGSIRIENTTKSGDATVILISAEEGC